MSSLDTDCKEGRGRVRRSHRYCSNSSQSLAVAGHPNVDLMGDTRSPCGTIGPWKNLRHPILYCFRKGKRDAIPFLPGSFAKQAPLRVNLRITTQDLV